MKRLRLSENNKKEIADEAIKTLESGGLVVVPSDTVYGLSVDATNEEAVKKLISFKSRPTGKPISTFVGNMERLRSYVKVTENQEATLNNILPGPFTIVLPSRHKTSPLLEAENGSLGVRVPDYEFINSLVEDFSKPITATSANLAGKSPHYSIEALLNSLSDKKKELIDLIIDAGSLPQRKPSTVIDMIQDSIKVLRKGEGGLPIPSQGEEDTRKIALDLIEKYYAETEKKPVVFLLIGTLGAGKTVFSKAIAEFLGVSRVVSPTFVIYYEYDVEKAPVKKFVHVDLYRLQNVDEFEHLGLTEYLAPGTIMSIEWAEKSSPLIKILEEKAHVIIVHIDYTSAQGRSITIKE